VRRAALALISIALAAGPAGALETDQYAAWGVPLTDAAPMVNAWFNRELALVVAEANRGGNAPRPACWIADRFQARIRYAAIFHPIEIWCDTTGLVDRYPDGWNEHDAFWRRTIYRDHAAFDISLWMPLGPTIRIGEVRIGTDKLAHFVSLGWQSFVRYRKLVADGVDPRMAIDTVIRWQILGERNLLLGYRTSGVFSTSDLEADYRGLLFYRDLCEGPDPVLELLGGRWRIRRAIDIRRYVTPEWDESYEPQLFRPGRWKRIRPVLEGYCEALDTPWVRELWKRYRAHDTLTPVERIILGEIRRGRLPELGRYTIEGVCGRPPRPWSFEGSEDAGFPALDPASLEPLEARIEAETEARSPRTFVLWRAGWYAPAGPAGAVSLLRAPFREGQHCPESCELDGPFLQLTAGAAGGGISFGWTQFIGQLHRDDRTMAEASLAWGIKGTVLRTWGDPWGERPERTFVGPGFEFSVARINLELEALWAPDGSGDWSLAWGIGFGF